MAHMIPPLYTPGAPTPAEGLRPTGRDLSGRTLLMSGGSRGIGLAIALRAAQDGANVAIMAKTDQPHPALPGTIHTAAEEIRAAGGRALAIVGDVRDDESVAAAVEQTVAEFGGIDVVVNNASAIDLSGTESLSMKKYDLMQDINARGTFLLSKLSLGALKASDNPHILTLSPPISLDPAWFGGSLAYTMAKYGMSMTTIGLAEELKDAGVAVNSLWPATTIDTAAVRNVIGGEKLAAVSRTPEIVADAAHAILTQESREVTGRFLIDEDVLAAVGVTDLSVYGGEGPFARDHFLD
ncbi:citronellol/citronellal dehydrogenase [Falsarthrobacter nasiphocae]|uniref:Citronellol/citronellal dehydrogenase n=2 Tax=Falsarthrobacter nasiphocae TaxID=189863 RepID=A0AAE3YIY7_9MICC|nr:NAD(P)-dependent oxidoreductase [Falsarthrobacter nasiphocae]MDR6892591.1 citronellol/citronellal dehydrogenase [Falsarthrobacter nasiphocae]